VSWRLFVAILLPEDVRREVGGVTRAIQGALGESAARAVKWVSEQNIHVTVKFLGEVAEPLVAPIEEALAGATAHHQPFDIQPHGVGCFPNARRANVLWVGTVEGLEPMTRLAADVERALEPLGFAPEGRRFRAHFTIGRVRRDSRVDGLEAALASVQAAAERLPGFTACELSLMKSDLRPEGPVYTRLSGAALGTVESPGPAPGDLPT
jgi:2'-5' RNA ligase